MNGTECAQLHLNFTVQKHWDIMCLFVHFFGSKMVSFMFKALTVLTFWSDFNCMLHFCLELLCFFVILFFHFGDTMLLFGKDLFKPHEGSLALKERTALYSTLDFRFFFSRKDSKLCSWLQIKGVLIILL